MPVKEIGTRRKPAIVDRPGDVDRILGRPVDGLYDVAALAHAHGLEQSSVDVLPSAGLFPAQDLPGKATRVQASADLLKPDEVAVTGCTGAAEPCVGDVCSLLRRCRNRNAGASLVRVKACARPQL